MRMSTLDCRYMREETAERARALAAFPLSVSRLGAEAHRQTGCGSRNAPAASATRLTVRRGLTEPSAHAPPTTRAESHTGPVQPDAPHTRLHASSPSPTSRTHTHMHRRGTIGTTLTWPCQSPRPGWPPPARPWPPTRPCSPWRSQTWRASRARPGRPCVQS